MNPWLLEEKHLKICKRISNPNLATKVPPHEYAIWIVN